jgi:hypothetical protein
VVVVVVVVVVPLKIVRLVHTSTDLLAICNSVLSDHSPSQTQRQGAGTAQQPPSNQKDYIKKKRKKEKKENGNRKPETGKQAGCASCHIVSQYSS